MLVMLVMHRVCGAVLPAFGETKEEDEEEEEEEKEDRLCKSLKRKANLLVVIY